VKGEEEWFEENGHGGDEDEREQRKEEDSETFVFMNTGE